MTIPSASVSKPRSETVAKVFEPAYGLLITVVLIVFTLCSCLLVQQYKGAEESAFATSENLTRVIAERLESALRRADSDVRTLVETLPPAAMLRANVPHYEAGIEARLRSNLTQFPEVASRMVVDVNGDVLYRAGTTSAKQFNFADREWFGSLRDQPDLELYLSDVTVARASQRPIIVMAHAVRDSQGRFLGAATATINVDAFDRLLATLDVGVHGLITVRNFRSGKFVLRYPPEPESLGAPVRFASTQRIMDGEKHGRVLAVSPLDQIERAIAFRVLEGYPFVTSVGLAKKDYLYAWRRTAEIFGFASIGLVLFLAVFVAHRIRAERSLKLLASELSASRQELRDVIESTSDGILVEGADGRVIIANQRFLKLWGIADGLKSPPTRSELFDCLSSQLDEAASEALAQSMAPDGKVVGLPTLALADGRRVEAYMSALEHDGAPAGRVWSFRDVTMRMATEQQLAQAQKMEAIGQLTGGLAHDFNNILNIVQGSLDLIEVQAKGDVELRDAALAAARRGSEITRSLLAVARRTKPDATAAKVGGMILELVPLLRQIVGKKMELIVAVECPDAVLKVDQSAFCNAMINLVINARDAMPGGGSCAIRVTEKEAIGDAGVGAARHVQVEVTDNGCGMEPDLVARAFDPFFTTKDRGSGTGLGLATVYAFAKQAGGEAAIASRPGAGTTVSLRLPVDTTHCVVAPAGFSGELRGRGERVLFVDDEHGLASISKQWLAALGYRVVVESDAQRALSRLEAQPFDALVTDVVMPGVIDGVALADRATQFNPGIAVLLVSGNTCGRLERVAGRFSLLDKPYGKQKLGAALRSVLDRAAKRVVPAERDAA